MTTTERRGPRPFTVEELDRLPYGGSKRELIDGILIVHPGSTPFTVADLAAMPDNGCRHELIDGMLVVTPPPDLRHQVVARALFRALDAAAPPDLTVLFAPVGVTTVDGRWLEPDLLVVPTDALGGARLSRAPLLVVEILSPDTRRYDQTYKRSGYEASAIQAYWLVDPATRSLTVLELVEGAYSDVAAVTGDDSWTATRPFDVTISPAQLSD